MAPRRSNRKKNRQAKQKPSIMRSVNTWRRAGQDVVMYQCSEWSLRLRYLGISVSETLRAMGHRLWAWKWNIAIPAVGLAIFGYWAVSLVKEMETPPPSYLRANGSQSEGKNGFSLVDLLEESLSAEAEQPEPAPYVIAGEMEEMVFIEPAEEKPPEIVPLDTPSKPALSAIQIFAKLDRGEITIEESKALLAARNEAEIGLSTVY